MWYVPAGMDTSVFRRCTIQRNRCVYVKETFGHTLELDVEETTTIAMQKMTTEECNPDQPPCFQILMLGVRCLELDRRIMDYNIERDTV